MQEGLAHRMRAQPLDELQEACVLLIRPRPLVEGGAQLVRPVLPAFLGRAAGGAYPGDLLPCQSFKAVDDALHTCQMHQPEASRLLSTALSASELSVPEQRCRVDSGVLWDVMTSCQGRQTFRLKRQRCMAVVRLLVMWNRKVLVDTP